ncbi:TetR/AcrR family transcriptional regulator [Microbacterium saperdae]|uniref:TetR/AcrR family transcriptional regulator n=1 Tax=Microbacterium saperdae TaxID=69368 RepID=UPI001150BB24|nr:TetR/AcrR family transcriptional regulator [Microbacterium saperdae]
MTLTSSGGRPAPRRRPGRPPAVDADAIATAVVEIGFAELTFASVAERLGVGQATLYRHAKNRDELVRLGLDRALRTADWPDVEGEWRPLLERFAIASWHAWEQHPGAVLEVARGVVPWSIVKISDQVGTALVERGFSARAAVLAVDLVFDLTADSRRGVETLDAPTADAKGGMRELIEKQWRSPSPDGVSVADSPAAQVHAEMLRAITAGPFEWFHGKLQVVLAGIEHELAGTGGG